jgi:acetyl esterase/lipase
MNCNLAALHLRIIFMIKIVNYLALLLASLTSACSSVSLYNTLAPRDGGVKQVGKDIPFGSDPRQKLDVYQPTGKIKAQVIVFIYGGSWANGRRQDYGFVASSLAAKGYVTIVPDYRLYPKVKFPAFIEDGALAVAWVQANAQKYGADPTRIILMGHSAGAYNVSMIGLDRKYLQTVGVDLKHIKAVVGLSGPYDFYPWDTDLSRVTFGSAPDPLATQPITYVRVDAPPMLLLTGDSDKTVRPRNSVSLAAKLKATGVEVKLKQYPKMDHAGIVLAISKPFRYRAPVLDDVVTFIDSLGVLK